MPVRRADNWTYSDPVTSAGARPSRRTLLAVRICAMAVTVLAAAAVLWTLQTADALLRVGSFLGAVGEVLFWGWPAFLAYLVIPRRLGATIAWGLVVSALTVNQWWASSTDWHSTASLRPGLIGWLLPAVVIFAVCAFRLTRRFAGSLQQRSERVHT